MDKKLNTPQFQGDITIRIEGNGTLTIPEASLAHNPHDYCLLHMIVAQVANRVKAAECLQLSFYDIVMCAYTDCKTASIYRPDMDIKLAQQMVTYAVNDVCKAIKSPFRDHACKMQVADERRFTALDKEVDDSDDKSTRCDTLKDRVEEEAIGRPDEEAAKELSIERIKAEVEKLPERERTIINMVSQGKSYTEIGKALKVSDVAIGKTVRKVYAQLREKLADEADD